MKNPYAVIKSRYLTEKTKVLEALQHAKSNPCLERCRTPKYVFLVDRTANKREIAHAVEEIYREKQIKVLKVNTITTSRKEKRRGRGRIGHTASVKKAIVTMEAGDNLE